MTIIKTKQHDIYDKEKNQTDETKKKKNKNKNVNLQDHQYDILTRLVE